MSVEANKAIIRRGIEEIWNKGDLSVVDEIRAPDCVSRFTPSTNAITTGSEQYKTAVQMFRAAFPDLKLTIEQLIAEGDKVVCHWTNSGTHQGEYMGSAPTGKSFTIQGITIFRFASAKVVEEIAIWDALDGYQQLGILPPRGEL